MNNGDNINTSEEHKTNKIISRDQVSIAEKNPCDLDYPFETGRFKNTFKSEESIGAGSFGEVYKAIHKLDKGTYAIKKVSIRESNNEALDATLKTTLREVSAMVTLNHQSIVRYITCWIEKAQEEESSEEGSQSSVTPWLKPDQLERKDEFSYQSESSNSAFSFDRGSQQNAEGESDLDEINKTQSWEGQVQSQKICLYIQLEYCAGMTLKDYLNRQKTERPVLKMIEMFHRILDGVNVFHKVGILHRDLKPANIFLDNNDNIKIGDFGLAVNRLERLKECQDNGQSNQAIQLSLTQGVGTERYMSPEIAKDSKTYDQKSDIYSLGIMFFEMLQKFDSEHEKFSIFDALRKGKLSETFTKDFPEESEIIIKMIDTIPENRPNAGALLALLSKLKYGYNNKKFMEGNAEVIGFNGILMDPPAILESLLVRNESGTFSINQGLKGNVRSNPPSLGKRITFRYDTLDSKGCPTNPVYVK